MIQFVPTEPPQLLIETEGAYSIVVTLEYDLSELYFELGCWIQSTDLAAAGGGGGQSATYDAAVTTPTLAASKSNPTQPERETQHGNTDDDYKIHHRLRRLGS